MAHASQTMRAGWTAVALGSCIAALSADAGVEELPCDDFPSETLLFTGAVQSSTVPLNADQVADPADPRAHAGEPGPAGRVPCRRRDPALATGTTIDRPETQRRGLNP